MIPYAASKFALVGLSSGLRTELTQDGILVTTICPGVICHWQPTQCAVQGQHQKEYAWFSIGDSLPLVSMDVQAAARKILLACQRGDAEVIITGPGNLAVWLQTLAPNMMTEFLALVNHILPEMGGIGQNAARGFDSESKLSPSWLTTLGDRAAAQNNEMTATQ